MARMKRINSNFKPLTRRWDRSFWITNSTRLRKLRLSRRRSLSFSLLTELLPAKMILLAKILTSHSRNLLKRVRLSTREPMLNAMLQDSRVVRKLRGLMLNLRLRTSMRDYSEPRLWSSL